MEMTKAPHRRLGFICVHLPSSAVKKKEGSVRLWAPEVKLPLSMVSEFIRNFSIIAHIDGNAR